MVQASYSGIVVGVVVVVRLRIVVVMVDGWWYKC